MTGIYAIHNIVNNKYYIWQALDIKRRWIQHKSHLKCGKHENCHLQNAYNIYGKESFEYIVIEECSKELLNDKEVFYINLYDSYKNGYNQDLGGLGCSGYKHTEEEISKMRLIQNPKAVLQLDKNLNIINEWVSASHAGKTLNFSIKGIKACCERINHQKTLHGYIWVYKEDYDSNIIDWNYYTNINICYPKKIAKYDMGMNLIKIYNSAYEANKIDGYNCGEIGKACNGKIKTYKGYIWKYI